MLSSRELIDKMIKAGAFNTDNLTDMEISGSVGGIVRLKGYFAVHREVLESMMENTVTEDDNVD